MRSPRILAAVALAAALSLSACGSDDESTTGLDPVQLTGTSATPSPEPSSSSSASSDDVELTGDALQRASDAALAAVGGGTVREAKNADADELHTYEVEIDLSNGEDVEVDLDENFEVVDIDR